MPKKEKKINSLNEWIDTCGLMGFLKPKYLPLFIWKHIYRFQVKYRIWKEFYELLVILSISVIACLILYFTTDIFN